MKTAYEWTAPYCGVSHLDAGAPYFQVTIEDYGQFVEAIVLSLKSAHPFTPMREGTFASVEEAKQWAEAQARQLGIE